LTFSVGRNRVVALKTKLIEALRDVVAVNFML
jgi:hypothetical protein